jgi:hypothetical protein
MEAQLAVFQFQNKPADRASEPVAAGGSSLVLVVMGAPGRPTTDLRPKAGCSRLRRSWNRRNSLSRP